MPRLAEHPLEGGRRRALRAARPTACTVPPRTRSLPVHATNYSSPPLPNKPKTGWGTGRGPSGSRTDRPGRLPSGGTWPLGWRVRARSRSERTLRALLAKAVNQVPCEHCETRVSSRNEYDGCHIGEPARLNPSAWWTIRLSSHSSGGPRCVQSAVARASRRMRSDT